MGWKKDRKRARKRARRWMKKNVFGPDDCFSARAEGTWHNVAMSAYYPEGYEVGCQALGILVWGKTPKKAYAAFREALRARAEAAGKGEPEEPVRPAHLPDGVDDWVVRYGGGGEELGAAFDELVVGRWFHMERLEDDAWWIGVTRPDGKRSTWVVSDIGSELMRVYPQESEADAREEDYVKEDGDG